MNRKMFYTVAGALMVSPLISIYAAPALGPVFAQATQTATVPRTITNDKRPVVHSDGVKFGAYDPHGDFAEQSNVDTEGLFLPWEDVDLTTLNVADQYALQRKRKLLITIEPWSWNENRRLSADKSRVKVLNGDYDPNIQAISDVIKSLKSPIIIRFAQEMEDSTTVRFSWQGWPPQDYIKAYRRVVGMIRKDNPNIQAMWSPKGLDGLQKYYPGDGYVDIIGLSVFGLQKFDKITYGKEKNFSETLQPGYDRVATFKKPIWVAELGYEGDASYVLPWIQTATATSPKFPDLKEVVYFNDRDVHPWPYNLGLPNWRVKMDSASD